MFCTYFFPINSKYISALVFNCHLTKAKDKEVIKEVIGIRVRNREPNRVKVKERDHNNQKDYNTYDLIMKRSKTDIGKQ